jgi:hypothetical protein
MDDGPWFCSIADEEIGPLDGHGLKELVRSGAVQAHDKVRLGHDGKWKPAGQVPGLFDATPDAGGDDVILGEGPLGSYDALSDQAVLETSAAPIPTTPIGAKGVPTAGVTPPPRVKQLVRPAPVKLQPAAPDGPPAWLKPVLTVGMGLLLVAIVGLAGMLIYFSAVK